MDISAVCNFVLLLFYSLAPGAKCMTCLLDKDYFMSRISSGIFNVLSTSINTALPWNKAGSLFGLSNGIYRLTAAMEEPSSHCRIRLGEWLSLVLIPERNGLEAQMPEHESQNYYFLTTFIQDTSILPKSWFCRPNCAQNMAEKRPRELFFSAKMENNIFSAKAQSHIYVERRSLQWKQARWFHPQNNDLSSNNTAVWEAWPSDFFLKTFLPNNEHINGKFEEECLFQYSSWI